MLRSVAILCSFSAVALTFSGCGGGVSAVPPPTPITISSLSPSSATAGMRSNVPLTITGLDLALRYSDSQPGRTVALWTADNSQTSLSTTVISNTELRVVVPQELLTAPVKAQISIEKWARHGEDMESVLFAVSNTLTFTVTSSATHSIVPAAETLRVNGTRQFAATGFDDNSKVTWSVEEGTSGGTISADGYYTAPATTGTFHVLATSVSDLSSATALVTVSNAGFAPTGMMHVPRTGQTATLLSDGKVLIVGGGDATAELFDPASGTFSFTGPPVTGRLDATATLLRDGRVLIAGGLGLTAGPDGSLPLLNTAEIFDPATGTFSSTGTMMKARREHAAIQLEDGRVLVAGGYYDHICFTASAELFDPTIGMFSSTGFMLSERVGHTVTLLSSGEVLTVGGSNGCAPDAADDPPWDPLFAEKYEPNSGSFQATGNMSTTRVHHAAVRLSDGKVLVLGGIPPVQNLHAQPPNPSYAELYDPGAKAFLTIAGLTISHERYTATLMTSGMVLIAGGEDASNTPTTEAELLDPRSGVLTLTGALGTARSGHTATLLQDGSVLVTGGTDTRGNALATSELYK